MKNRMIWLRRTVVAVLCVFTIAVASARGQVAQPAAAADAVVVQGLTKPYAHGKPNVSQYGAVLKLPIKEGDAVKEGQILLQQDDREERAELARLQLEADSNVRVDASDATLKIKQVQLERAQELFKSHNASRFEVEQAESEVIAAKAQADIARLDLAGAKQKAIGQQAKVDKMTIKSPITGRVETLDVVVGDITDPQKPIMTLVQNDPLKVEFYLPVTQAAKLQMNQVLQVRYPSEDKWMNASVKYKSPMADAASGTQKVGLEMPNPENRDSGMDVQIKLPADAGGNAPAAAAR